MTPTERFTLAAATTLHPAYWQDMTRAELDLEPADVERAVRVWLWLCDVPPTATEAVSLRREVEGDPELIVALSLPAAEFVRWLRCAEWEHFDSTERTGGEAWAFGALQRAWGACCALGAMATQCSIGAPQEAAL